MTGTRIALLVTLSAATLATLAYPGLAISPGTLRAGHAPMRNGCMSCHVPMQGATRDKCIACHRLDTIGVQFTDGRPRVPATPRTSLVHQALSGVGSQCYACHSEHAGASGAVANMRFSHEVLPVALRAQCLTCHATERPKDGIHANLEANCSTCHGAERWKPATIDHDRFFRFDRKHPATCVSCHQVPTEFKRYTCYGCHEHSPARMASEHRDERVVNLDLCAACHRSGNEHDIRRGGQAGEGGSRGDGKRRRSRDDDN